MLPSRTAVTEGSFEVKNEVYYDALVWLDHSEAHIIYVSAGISDPQNSKPDHWSRHVCQDHVLSTHASTIARQALYCDVAKFCSESNSIVLAGLTSAKTEFVKYLHRHSPETLERVSGIETLARLTDLQLVSEARRFFAGHAYM